MSDRHVDAALPAKPGSGQVSWLEYILALKIAATSALLLSAQPMRQASWQLINLPVNLHLSNSPHIATGTRQLASHQLQNWRHLPLKPTMHACLNHTG